MHPVIRVIARGVRSPHSEEAEAEWVRKSVELDAARLATPKLLKQAASNSDSRVNIFSRLFQHQICNQPCEDFDGVQLSRRLLALFQLSSTVDEPSAESLQVSFAEHDWRDPHVSSACGFLHKPPPSLPVSHTHTVLFKPLDLAHSELPDITPQQADMIKLFPLETFRQLCPVIKEAVTTTDLACIGPEVRLTFPVPLMCVSRYPSPGHFRCSFPDSWKNVKHVVCEAFSETVPTPAAVFQSCIRHRNYRDDRTVASPMGLHLAPPLFTESTNISFSLSPHQWQLHHVDNDLRSMCAISNKLATTKARVRSGSSRVMSIPLMHVSGQHGDLSGFVQEFAARFQPCSTAASMGGAMFCPDLAKLFITSIPARSLPNKRPRGVALDSARPHNACAPTSGNNLVGLKRKNSQISSVVVLQGDPTSVAKRVRMQPSYTAGQPPGNREGHAGTSSIEASRHVGRATQDVEPVSCPLVRDDATTANKGNTASKPTLRLITDPSKVDGVDLWRHLGRSRKWSFEFVERSLPETVLLIIDRSTCICIQSNFDEDLRSLCSRYIDIANHFRSIWVLLETKPSDPRPDFASKLLQIQTWFWQISGMHGIQYHVRMLTRDETLQDAASTVLQAVEHASAAYLRDKLGATLAGWAERRFLQEIESQKERLLSSIPGLNCFFAMEILELFDMSQLLSAAAGGMCTEEPELAAALSRIGKYLTGKSSP